MSHNPGTILYAVISPTVNSNDAMKAILLDNVDAQAVEDDDCEICLEGEDFNLHIMESEYLEQIGISAEVGDLAVWNYLTHDTGDYIVWGELERRRDALARWAERMCLKHGGSYEIRVAANYM